MKYFLTCSITKKAAVAICRLRNGMRLWRSMCRCSCRFLNGMIIASLCLETQVCGLILPPFSISGNFFCSSSGVIFLCNARTELTVMKNISYINTYRETANRAPKLNLVRASFDWYHQSPNSWPDFPLVVICAVSIWRYVTRIKHNWYAVIFWITLRASGTLTVITDHHMMQCICNFFFLPWSQASSKPAGLRLFSRKSSSLLDGWEDKYILCCFFWCEISIYFRIVESMKISMLEV